MTDRGQYLLAFRIPRTQYGSPVIQKMFVFLGIGEKGNTGADVIAKGWKDNGWSIPTVEEKSNPDRIETCLKLKKYQGHYGNFHDYYGINYENSLCNYGNSCRYYGNYSKNNQQ